MIKLAQIEDIEIILPMVIEFVEESSWGWKFNAQNSCKILNTYIKSEETAVLFNDDCFALVAFDDEFHNERLGFVSKFYVSKTSRGKGLGRELIKACDDWFVENNCNSSFATATANIEGEGNLFNNLLKKFGYKECGQTLVRKYEQV